MRKKFGRLGGAYLALTADPQSTKAWAVGARGERELGAILETFNNDRSLIVLHDRRIPRTRANVDHIVIGPRGIFVIDAKRYSGSIRKLDKGGWFTIDQRLYVGRRDCTKLVVAMAKQVAAVRNALGEATMQEFEVRLTPVLCFLGVEPSLFARPFQLGGVWIERPKSLGKRIQQPGHLEPEHVRTLAKRVAAALPKA